MTGADYRPLWQRLGWMAAIWMVAVRVVAIGLPRHRAVLVEPVDRERARRIDASPYNIPDPSGRAYHCTLLRAVCVCRRRWSDCDQRKPPPVLARTFCTMGEQP